MGERYRGLVLLREAFLERILANNTDVITDTPWGPGARLSRALRTVGNSDHSRAGMPPGRMFMHRQRWA